MTNAMTAAHTPGPWRAAEMPTSMNGIEIVSDGAQAVTVDHQRRARIAAINHTFNANSREDARLIAAAPQLAEALRGLVLCIEQHERLGHKVADPRLEAARAALAAAGVQS